MANYKFVYNALEVDIELPVDDYLMLEFDVLDVSRIADFISRLSASISNIPTLTADTLIILNAMAWSVDENVGWVAPLNSLAECIPNKIIVINGKLSNVSRNIPELKFGLYRICQFSQFSNLIFDKQSIESGRDVAQDINYPRDKKLYWASTKDILWRRYMLAGLYENNIIEDSLVNYKCIESAIPHDITQYNDEENLDEYTNVKTIAHKVENREHIIDDCVFMQHRVPLPPLDSTDQVEKTDPAFYLRAFVGLTVETFYECPGIFFSEKVFNSIAYKQIFFYVGGHNAVKYLRDKGYNTFDHVFDTSYDDIEHPWQRLLAARRSLIEFLNKPLEEIAEIYNDCKPLIEQNFELYRNDDFGKNLHQSIDHFLNNEKTA